LTHCANFAHDKPLFSNVTIVVIKSLRAFGSRGRGRFSQTSQ
jgi:hypothetical protein